VNKKIWVSLWKHIRRGWDAFFSFVSIEVGNGARSKFGTTFGVGILL
jgi:hypothetical protein